MWKTVIDRILKIKVCVPEGKTGVELSVLFLPGNVLCFQGCLVHHQAQIVECSHAV